MFLRMDMVTPELADRIIDALDGTSAVARLLHLAPSTVHSWRKIGLTAARADHLRLAARAIGRSIDFETGGVHGDDDYGDGPTDAPGKNDVISPSTCAAAGGVN